MLTLNGQAQGDTRTVFFWLPAIEGTGYQNWVKSWAREVERRLHQTYLL